MTVPRLMEILAGLDYIDGIITQGVWTKAKGSIPTADEVREVIAEAEGVTSILKKYDKPIVATAMRWRPNNVAIDLFKKAGIPMYDTPEETARAMWGLARYGQIRRGLGEA